MKNINRREFIKNSSALLAGAALMPSWLELVPKTELGIQLWSVRDELRKDALGTLKALSKIGFDYVEVFGYNEGKIFGYTATEMKKVVNDLGMTIQSGHFTLTAKHYDKSKKSFTDDFKRAVEDAQKMGQRYFINPWMNDEDRNEESVKYLCELMNKAGELCKAHNMRFGYHNHAFEFEKKFGNNTMYQAILDNTERRNVVMELDLCWAVRAKQSPAYWFNKYPGRFHLAHMKDLKSQDKDETAIVGEGVVGFRDVIEAQMQSGMRMWIVELEHYKGTSVADVGVSFKNLRKMMK